MPTSKPQTSALAVLSDRQNCTPVQISKLQSVAIQQLAMVKGLERDAALRAILVGLTLHRIKASLAHGEFMPWIKAKVQGAAYRQCNYFLKLAAVFVEKTRVTRPEFLALPGDQTDLAIKPADAQARRFMDKATKFVGEASLNELLDEHRIKDTKKLGGRRDAGDSAPAKIDPERVAEMKREEASEWLARAQQLFVEENIFQHLKPDERKTVVESLEAIAAKARAALKDSAT
jgi:hypothetical protein